MSMRRVHRKSEPVRNATPARARLQEDFDVDLEPFCSRSPDTSRQFIPFSFSACRRSQRRVG